MLVREMKEKRNGLLFAVSMDWFLLIHVIAPILLGISIYLLFRNTEELLFSLIGDFSVYKLSLEAPEWIKYNLPDGLWLYAALSFQLFIWEHKIALTSATWMMSLFIMGVGSEYLQYLELIPGTWDAVDIYAYITSGLMVLLTNQFIIKREDFPQS